MNSISRLQISIAIPILLAGCVNGTKLYSDETLTWKATLLKKPVDEVTANDKWLDDDAPYANRIAFARNLADRYMAQAGKVSNTKDAAAVGLIGTAAVAAGGLFYDAGLGLVKGTGLAAGTITTTMNYAKPDDAEAALLNAAEALICVASVAQGGKQAFTVSAATEPKGSEVKVASTGGEAEAAGILDDTILRIRLNLRGKLTRKISDYRSLLDDFKAYYKPDARGVVSDLDGLRSRTAECIIRAGA
ncbi:hypothetical protein RCCGE510_12551 [Rhizobium sp. CCGE 510]|nr:hypothetical protein RCCGE510_12551 [Rhizobium sp. CCGE 510]